MRSHKVFNLGPLTDLVNMSATLNLWSSLAMQTVPAAAASLT
jgi:hypothetical protein